VRQPLLGHGSDGAVWRTSRNAALKILEKQKNYDNELECYRRFQRADIVDIGGYSVPRLEDHDDDLRAIEMSIVDPPYLLDFGKVRLDVAPPYYRDKQLWSNTLAEWRRLFGKDWKDVAFAMSPFFAIGFGFTTPIRVPRTFARGTTTREKTHHGKRVRRLDLEPYEDPS